MTIRFIRPESKAARYALQLAVVALLMLLASWATFRFGPLRMPDFVMLALASGGLALISVPLALWGLLRLWQVGAKGGIASCKALVVAALPLAVLGVATNYYVNRPHIYEVATDLDNPVEWIRRPVASQGWLPRPKSDLRGHAQEQATAYPTLTLRSYDGALDRIYQAARTVAANQRLTVTATAGAAYARPDFPTPSPVPALLGADAAIKAPIPIPMPRPEPAPEMPDTDNEPPGTIRIQALSRDFILGIPSDIVIRLREKEDSVQVDMRVASRFGPHDLGLSAYIANRYLAALDGALLGSASQ
ncbi:DUF1499 domain-containing protein [Rhizobium sp.]|jgi:hypothetical protein|uniref:DUF1499 domain-containing protein n=1 Tax=Rhizobium sp. TaxID=391 RepID=UPI000E971557|nr:hypothetical protein [Rhizobium sp.]